MKKLRQSRTFWLAVFQAFAGIIIVALTELDLVGYAALGKSLVDVVLRYVTKEPVKGVQVENTDLSTLRYYQLTHQLMDEEVKTAEGGEEEKTGGDDTSE